LQSYPWPGNIREIRNFVERLYILVSGDQIGIEDLRFAGLVEIHGSSEQQLLNFREARAEFEKEFLLRKINENQGNISRTAEVIGLERSYLHRKIKAYGIEV
jgi:two-component system nitrogen regulation response regulator NtrX